MLRPFMRYGIEQLEEMFAKAKADSKLLKLLEAELRYRQVPKAIALLAEVQAAMYSGISPKAAAVDLTAVAQAPATQQPRLLDNHRDEGLGNLHPPSTGQPRLPQIASPLQVQTESETIAIGLHEAYKLLRATSGSTWESIEQTRRLLVQQAHPSRISSFSSTKRLDAEEDAARVNAAYLRLSNERCSS